MPSPIAHLLAGALVGVTGRAARNPHPRWHPPVALLLVCAGLAALPDSDLLLPITHRAATHSLVAVALVTILAAGVTGWVTGRLRWDVALVCGLAYSTHLLLDWLGTDTYAPRGIQILWPFDDRWFISGWDLFPRIERRAPFSAETIAINARAAVYEIATMVPTLAAAVYLRRKTHGAKRM
jgi:membrane-bound metal-dependent hydrolase YbcI (DUF457 family)